jgi:hypothetical protein
MPREDHQKPSHSRPANTSLEIRQNLLNLFAAQQGSARPCAQDGETSHGVGDNSDVARTLLSRCQNNASRFDLNIEEITGEDAHPAAKRARKHDLALGGNSGFHNMAILSPLDPRQINGALQDRLF